MSEPARPIPVKLDAETLASLDALVAAGRQPTRSAAIRAGIELLLDAEHRRAIDLGMGTAPAATGTGGHASVGVAPVSPVRRRQRAETYGRGPGWPEPAPPRPPARAPAAAARGAAPLAAAPPPAESAPEPPAAEETRAPAPAEPAAPRARSRPRAVDPAPSAVPSAPEQPPAAEAAEPETPAPAPPAPSGPRAPAPGLGSVDW
jgi:Arc/MetJ-type ribon-helix-helix transcriptional regulator